MLDLKTNFVIHVKQIQWKKKCFVLYAVEYLKENSSYIKDESYFNDFSEKRMSTLDDFISKKKKQKDFLISKKLCTNYK